MQTGKFNKVDAVRIASYAAKIKNELELYKPLPEILEKVKILVKIRNLIKITRG